MAKDKVILWEVGCDGLRDAWVVAPDWARATVEAAAQWGVPWKQVAGLCFEKKRIENPKRNVCVCCGRIYSGTLPMCDMCKAAEKTEHERTRRAWAKACRAGAV